MANLTGRNGRTGKELMRNILQLHILKKGCWGQMIFVSFEFFNCGLVFLGSLRMETKVEKKQIKYELFFLFGKMECGVCPSFSTAKRGGLYWIRLLPPVTLSNGEFFFQSFPQTHGPRRFERAFEFIRNTYRIPNFLVWGQKTKEKEFGGRSNWHNWQSLHRKNKASKFPIEKRNTLESLPAFLFFRGLPYSILNFVEEKKAFANFSIVAVAIPISMLQTKT